MRIKILSKIHKFQGEFFNNVLCINAITHLTRRYVMTLNRRQLFRLTGASLGTALVSAGLIRRLCRAAGIYPTD